MKGVVAESQEEEEAEVLWSIEREMPRLQPPNKGDQIIIQERYKFNVLAQAEEHTHTLARNKDYPTVGCKIPLQIVADRP